MNMKLINFSLLVFTTAFLFSCTSTKNDKSIDEDELGIIVADVKSEETNLKEKAKFSDSKPGTAQIIERSFENAPPMIPHTVKGFLPIKIDNNICMSCHMPDKVEETKATAIPKMHFTNLRPDPKPVGDKYYFSQEDTLVKEESENFDNAYFNCNQCHVPQANISVDIENLFSPEFRQEFGLSKSSLDKQLEDGIK